MNLKAIGDPVYLALGVHAVAIDEDLVLLDTRADAYLCLLDGAAHLALTPRGEVQTTRPALAQALIEADLLSSIATPRQPPPPRPVRSLWPPAPARPGARRMLAAVRATLDARRGLSRLAFEDLIRPGAPRQPAAAEDLQADLAGFEALRPWLPMDGECLSRSYHLWLYLRARGHDAAWVFGVRTWPFMAHCWLQVGDTALDDDVERLLPYHPILAA